MNIGLLHLYDLHLRQLTYAKIWSDSQLLTEQFSHLVNNIFNLIKGSLAFDNTLGFWIVSSVPKFPANTSSGYTYLKKQIRYGQTILCVTIPKTAENDISIQVQIKVDVFLDRLILFSFIFTDFFFVVAENIFGTTNPYIYDKKNFDINKTNRQANSHFSLKSHNNAQLEVLAKSAAFQEGDVLRCVVINNHIIEFFLRISRFWLSYVLIVDIYDKWISPEMKDSFLVRTWRPKLPDTTQVWLIFCMHINIDNKQAIKHSQSNFHNLKNLDLFKWHRVFHSLQQQTFDFRPAILM